MHKSTFFMLFVTVAPAIFMRSTLALPYEELSILRPCFGSLCGACVYGGCQGSEADQPDTSPYEEIPHHVQSIVISNNNQVEIRTVEASPVTVFETSTFAATETVETTESVPTTYFDTATESVQETIFNTVTETSFFTQVVPTYVAVPVLPAVSIVENIPAPAPACFECQDVQPVPVAPADTPVDVTADNLNSVAVAPLDATPNEATSTQEQDSSDTSQSTETMSVQDSADQA